MRSPPRHALNLIAILTALSLSGCFVHNGRSHGRRSSGVHKGNNGRGHAYGHDRPRKARNHQR